MIFYKNVKNLAEKKQNISVKSPFSLATFSGETKNINREARTSHLVLMPTNRFSAIYDIATAPASSIKPAEPVNVDFYGEDVFNADAMRNYLS